jgi:hypothetical protein
MSTAYAFITITLDGNVIVTGDLDVQGNITGSTLDGLDSRITPLENDPRVKQIYDYLFPIPVDADGFIPCEILDMCTGNLRNIVPLGDVDGNGYSDVALANYSSDSIDDELVIVFLGNDFTILNHKTISTTELGFSNQDLSRIRIIGDLDDDGINELVVFDASTNDAFIVKVDNNGLVYSKSVGTLRNGGYLGDLDNDGVPDVANYNVQPTPVNVKFLNSDGTIKSTSNFDLSSLVPTGNTEMIVVGDVNKDGINDIAVRNGDPANDVFIVLLNADRSFNSTQTVDIGSTSIGGYGLRPVGDFNSDGIEEFGITDFGISVSFVSLNTNGTLKEIEAVVPIANAGIHNVISDLNNDGKDDLVGNTVYFYYTP